MCMQVQTGLSAAVCSNSGSELLQSLHENHNNPTYTQLPQVTSNLSLHGTALRNPQWVCMGVCLYVCVCVLFYSKNPVSVPSGSC